MRSRTLLFVVLHAGISATDLQQITLIRRRPLDHTIPFLVFCGVLRARQSCAALHRGVVVLMSGGYKWPMPNGP
eukprot:CAMPEP_0117585126 /NCGR_PEP_ID=MMETSP0784-20121206/67976_1 /TAXON_ID=39447 /ORGANISM="" /LENGTH=73 /DNA_ID=CAMNT_0005386047 /DNA_START=8 /DNA_END=226 /DNA_ORIENTATION=-